MGRNGPPPANLGRPIISPAPPPKRLVGIAMPGSPVPYAACYMGEDGKVRPLCPTAAYMVGSIDLAALDIIADYRRAHVYTFPDELWKALNAPLVRTSVAGIQRIGDPYPAPQEPPRVTTYTLQPRPDWLARVLWAFAAVAWVLIYAN